MREKFWGRKTVTIFFFKTAAFRQKMSFFWTSKNLNLNPRKCHFLQNVNLKPSPHIHTYQLFLNQRVIIIDIHPICCRVYVLWLTSPVEVVVEASTLLR